MIFFLNSFDGLYNYHLLNLLYNITYYAYNVNYVYLLVGCFLCFCFWLLVLRFISSFILISRLYKCNWNWIKRLLNVFKLFLKIDKRIEKIQSSKIAWVKKVVKNFFFLNSKSCLKLLKAFIGNSNMQEGVIKRRWDFGFHFQKWLPYWTRSHLTAQWLHVIPSV